MNKAYPKAAVIIPTYNRADLIMRTLKSALGQDYKNFEIIVIDDSRDDATERCIKTVNDSKIRYIHNVEKGNLPKARNQGVRESSVDTKYVAFLDDDNELLSSFLSKGIATLEADLSLVGIVPMSDHRFDDGTKIRIGPEINEPWNSGLGNGSLLRKELFVDEGFWFNENLLRSEEWDFGLRVLREHKVKQLSDVLQIYYHHYPSISGGTLSNAPLPLSAVEYFYDKYLDYYKTLGNKPLALFYFWIGKLYARAGYYKIGRGFFLKAFGLERKHIYIFYYLFWLFPLFARKFHWENVLYWLRKINML